MDPLVSSSCKCFFNGCCWHPSKKQHPGVRHTDFICCHCGGTKCEVKADPKIPEGHGWMCPH